jgi:hypothetical protein
VRFEKIGPQIGTNFTNEVAEWGALSGWSPASPAAKFFIFSWKLKFSRISRDSARQVFEVAQRQNVNCTPKGRLHLQTVSEHRVLSRQV